MKGWAVLAAISIGLASKGAYAQCMPLPVQVTILTPDPDIVMLTSHDVAAASGNFHAVQRSLPTGWHLNGLAQAKPSYTINVEGQVGPGCYRPTRVTVTIGFVEPIRVLVSAKYRPGTCEFENIRRHEMKHAAIYRNSVLAYSGLIHSEMSRAMSRLTSGHLASPQAQQIVSQLAQDVAGNVFSRMMADSRTQNAALDTIENYRREQAGCSNW